jgi:hypothetical protein
VYDMYPWDDPADTRSAELRAVPAAATRAVQVALDRRDNGGDAVPAAGQARTSQPSVSQPSVSQPSVSLPSVSQPSASQPPASLTRQ